MSTTPHSPEGSVSPGSTSTTPDRLGEAWDEALAAGRPALLDVRCDPTVPPIPPHSTREQAKALSEALVKGDEDAWDVAKNVAKHSLEQFLPGRHR